MLIRLFLLGVFLSSVSLAAAELHVAQDGSGDFLTIQQAADIAQAGDTAEDECIVVGVLP
jgi:hypothetical protein